MSKGATDTNDLIRALSLRQRMVALAVVILSLVSLALGWQLTEKGGHSDEFINLAGRQRMLSQRMALYLTLGQHEPDSEKRRQYRDTAIAVADEFDQAHTRLANAVATLDANTPIRSLYFGPTGNVDAESRRYLSQVRELMAAPVRATLDDSGNTTRILAAADSSLLKTLDQATALFQHDGEEKRLRGLRLLQVSTLLIVVLLAFGTFMVFRPAVRRLADDVARRDRTERELKDSQASLIRLQLAVEQSPVSIMIIGSDGKIAYVNTHFSAITGYSPDEAIGNRPRLLLWSVETPESTFADMLRTLNDGKTWRGEVCGRAKDGALFWEMLSVSPVCDDQGKRSHTIAVSEDITERKRIENELEQHRTHLEDLVETRTADLMDALQAARVADEAKDAFLAHVSHELRTPLNAVIGLSELARHISTDPKQQDYLDKVTGAGKNLAAIINDLLDLSKISAGHMEFESISFSLHNLVQRSRSVMAHRAEEKGLVLIDRIDADVPDVLRGDPLRIEQILINLLSNAIKFTPSGQVGVHIGMVTRKGNRVCLRIDIEDTGIGMTDENLARLFQPFSQADASMNRKFGGTGLGLALSRRLAEVMEGDISVASRAGVGTTFSVRIWLDLGDATDLPETAHIAQAVLPVSYRNTQVLIVDDQPLNREIVEALLGTVGITSRTAADGREALDILRECGPHTFDLVLMDIQMPIMDGLTATREIRGWSRFDEIPIIAMTAHTMKHEKAVCTAAGMDDHIGKPFETANFFQLLARWIPALKHQMPTAAAERGGSAGSAGSAGSTDSPPAMSDADEMPAHSLCGLLSLPNIDTKGGLARFVGNEQRYRHWLLEFVAEAPDYAAQICRNLAEGNQEAARKSAHTIKGRVGMLGMTSLHSIMSALEAALKAGQPATDLLAQMEATAAGLCAEIQNAIGADAPDDASKEKVN